MAGYEFFLEGDEQAPVHLTKAGSSALGTAAAHAYMEHMQMHAGGPGIRI